MNNDPTVLAVGIHGTATFIVTDADTSCAQGSGDVPVLATPRLVALGEQACVDAVALTLEPGQTTVGSRVRVAHLAPTAVGGSVTATATLCEADGKRLVFNVSVTDGAGVVVGRGQIERSLVDRARFLTKVGIPLN